ncbi:MAG TPA: TrmH family RNA methyltransferase [Anaerolineales bacterium]|nr:TrmH family RNA methyltransferase [Anaerolineales bacterium]
MPTASFEIRICNSCGLRYPLVEGHPFGVRCPACMGETRSALRVRRQPLPEPRSSPSPSKSDRILESARRKGRLAATLLDNIRSAWNVGSILRSEDSFGFTHAYLCGITPTADHEAVTKTSLGAQDSVSWSYHKNAVTLAKGLKKEGWQVYALEEDVRSIPVSSFPSFQFLQRAVLIVGNEVTGVDPDLLDLCDQIFYIPMLGEKKSFNVAIAFSVAAYALGVQVLNRDGDSPG